MEVNVFTVLAVAINFASLIFLILYIVFIDTCSGISGNTQILYFFAFLTRNDEIALSVPFVILTLMVLYLIFVIRSNTYQNELDNSRIEFALISAAFSALVCNYSMTFGSVLWSFSNFCEALAMVPQFVMIRNNNWDISNVKYYLKGMFGYKILIGLNLIYEVIDGNSFDYISGITTLIYIMFFAIFYVHYICNKRKQLGEQGKLSKVPVQNNSEAIAIIYDGVYTIPEKTRKNNNC